MEGYDFKKHQLKKISLPLPFFLGSLAASNNASIASLVHDTLNNIATLADHYAAQGSIDLVLTPINQHLL